MWRPHRATASISREFISDSTLLLLPLLNLLLLLLLLLVLLPEGEIGNTNDAIRGFNSCNFTSRRLRPTHKP